MTRRHFTLEGLTAMQERQLTILARCKAYEEASAVTMHQSELLMAKFEDSSWRLNPFALIVTEALGLTDKVRRGGRGWDGVTVYWLTTDGAQRASEIVGRKVTGEQR